MPVRVTWYTIMLSVESPGSTPDTYSYVISQEQVERVKSWSTRDDMLSFTDEERSYHAFDSETVLHIHIKEK